MLKYIIVSILICVSILGCSPSYKHSNNTSPPYNYKTIRHYDRSMRLIGYSIKTSYGERHYDKNMRYIGQTRY